MVSSTRLLLIGGIIAIVAIVVTAGAIDTSLENDAGDLFDSPIAPYEDAIATEIDDRSEEAPTEGSYSEDSASIEDAQNTLHDRGSILDRSGGMLPGEGTSSSFVPRWPLVIALVLAMAIGIVHGVRSRRSAFTGREPRSVVSEGPAIPAGFAQPADNPVSEIWLAFATEVAPDRVDTLTTTEIAMRAIDSGMNPDAVWELTAAFEEVQYGGYPATDNRISRIKTARSNLEEQRIDS